jgi:transposase
MSIQYKVTLSSEERQFLEDYTKKGKRASRSVILARSLLLVDRGDHAESTHTTDEITSVLGISDRTLERAKKRFVEEGLDSALERKPMDTSTRAIKFDVALEARVIALARSAPPEGRTRWTVRLLAEKAVELELTDSMSHMTAQRILKKK